MKKEDQGVTRDRYLLIPRTLIFLFNDDKVLLLKGAPHKKLWAGRYNGLGGHVERGEDVLSSAIREVKEEAGIIPDDLWLSGIITVDADEDIGIGVYVFKGEYRGDNLTNSVEGSPEWVNTNGLENIPLVEDLPVLLQHILTRDKSAPAFFAQYSYDAEGKIVIRFHG